MSAVKLEDFTNHRKKNNKVEALSRRPIPNIPKWKYHRWNLPIFLFIYLFFW